MQHQHHLESLVVILDEAWQGGFTSRSSFARENAEVIAMATERDLITTRIGPNTYGNIHLITPPGLTTLWALKGIMQ